MCAGSLPYQLADQCCWDQASSLFTCGGHLSIVLYAAALYIVEQKVHELCFNWAVDGDWAHDHPGRPDVAISAARLRFFVQVGEGPEVFAGFMLCCTEFMISACSDALLHRNVDSSRVTSSQYGHSAIYDNTMSKIIGRYIMLYEAV